MLHVDVLRRIMRLGHTSISDKNTLGSLQLLIAFLSIRDEGLATGGTNVTPNRWVALVLFVARFSYALVARCAVRDVGLTTRRANVALFGGVALVLCGSRG